MKGEIDLTVARRIRDRREELGLTRDRLAEKADLSVTFLAQIELGRQSFSVVTLRKLCTALDITADEVLFGTEHSAGCSRAAMILAELDEEYLPLAEDLLRAYVQSVRLKASEC